MLPSLAEVSSSQPGSDSVLKCQLLFKVSRKKSNYIYMSVLQLWNMSLLIKPYQWLETEVSFFCQPHSSGLMDGSENQSHLIELSLKQMNVKLGKSCLYAFGSVEKILHFTMCLNLNQNWILVGELECSHLTIAEIDKICIFTKWSFALGALFTMIHITSLFRL